MKVLFVCTGNSCRSQMAEGFMKSFDKNFEVFSAGTNPAMHVSPFAILAMQEIGIDISSQKTNHINHFADQQFDYIITMSDTANKKYPLPQAMFKHRIHMKFDDPAEVFGDKEMIMEKYRKVRDEIEHALAKFYADFKK